MLTPLEWLARQSFATRFTFSMAFATVSAIAWFFGHIWPWGIFAAFAPLVLPSFFKKEVIDFESYADAKTRSDLFSLELPAESVGTAAEFVTQLLPGTPSVKARDAIIVWLGSRPPAAETKSFSFVGLVANKPMSLSLNLKAVADKTWQAVFVGDPEMVAAVRNHFNRTAKR